MNKTELGVSSSSSITGLLNSCSDMSELQQRELIEERKRKRKLSNRESARRSRLRKQKQLDDLASQVTNYKIQNNQLVAAISTSSQNYVAVESQNCILRAQLLELNHRLASLNEIVESSSYLGDFGMETGHGGGDGGGGGLGFYDGGMNHMDLGFYNQPVRGSADTTSDIFN